MQQVDILFRGATIVDGNGGDPYVGDLGVKDGKISHVGPSLEGVSARREIDATGKHLMPGFTDIHTHYDAQCMWDPLLSPSADAGVTTVVVGNCGVGVAPTREDGRDLMVATLQAVEDIPSECINEGIQWQTAGAAKPWESFGEYLDALDSLPLACDIAALVPMGCVRPYVLGPDRAALSDTAGGPLLHPLSMAEKQAVADCVQEAIEAGAIGFSLNRWWQHRDATGRLVPGTLADADEICMIAKAIAKGGGGAFQMHNDFKSFDDIPEEQMDIEMRKTHFQREWEWIKFISKEYGLTVNWLGQHLDRAVKANREGAHLKLQMLVRPQSFIFSWAARSHPFTASPTFRAIKNDAKLGFPGAGGGWVAALAAPVTRGAILQETAERCAKSEPMRLFWGEDSGKWGGWYPMREGFDYEPTPAESVAAIAAAEGRGPHEIVYDAMMGGAGTAGTTGAGVVWQGPEDVPAMYDGLRAMLSHEDVVPGISDAGAHLAIFQDGTTPSFMLTHWARGRKPSNGPTLPLAHVVQKQARDTAYLYGLTDRGTLEVGKKADLNVVDLAALTIAPPEHVNDFPTGAPRWKQRVTGYAMTVVAGEVTWEEGVHTGKLPGRLVRNPHHLKAADPVGWREKAEALPDFPPHFSGYREAELGPLYPGWEDRRQAGSGDGSGESASKEAVLRAALSADSGASNMSRISEVLDGEGASKSNKARL